MYTSSEFAERWVVFQPHLCFLPENKISQEWFNTLLSQRQPQQKCQSAGGRAGACGQALVERNVRDFT